MFSLSDPHHFRKMVAGLCMIAAPLLMLVAAVITPVYETDVGKQLAAVAGDADRFYIASLATLVALILLVPAILGLMHMLREREVAYGHLGGGLALLGSFLVMAIMGIQLVVWQMVAGGADRAEMIALLDRVNDTTGIVVPLFILSFAFALGFAILAAGLYRARAVHPWMAILIAAGGVMLPIGATIASEVVVSLGAVALLVGLGFTGWRVLMEPDSDWEHTPEVSGFRPLLGAR